MTSWESFMLWASFGWFVAAFGRSCLALLGMHVANRRMEVADARLAEALERSDKRAMREAGDEWKSAERAWKSWRAML